MPSTIKWVGIGAQPVAEVDTWTIGASDGGPLPGDVYSVTINGKTVSYTETGAATYADVCTGLQAALTASTIPEFLEVTWTVASPVIKGTAATPGMPFEATAGFAGANIPNPLLNNFPVVSVGGTLAGSTTFYYVITATNGNGSTQGSNQVSGLTTGSNKTITLTWPGAIGATGYKVFRTTSSGTYGASSLLKTIGSGATLTYVDDGSDTLGAGQPPGGNSASSTATFTHAVATASSGPFDLGAPANYSTGALPVTGDTLYFQDSSAPVLYHTDALSTVVLAALYRMASYTGQIGLPNNNPSGYYEYRPSYMQVQATTVNLGQGPGSGPVLEKYDFGSATASTVNVYSTGSGTSAGLPALLIIGTNAANVLNAYAGSLGIAAETNQTATFATVNAESSSQGGTTSILFGAGCTLTTITNTGATLDISSAFTTLTQYAGQSTLRAGAITTLNVNGGTILDVSADTITTLNVYSGGNMDLTGSLVAKTITTTTIYKGATLLDSWGRVTFTNGVALGGGCRIGQVVIDLGAGITLMG